MPYRKEIVDEAKKDELLQKMQKVIIKFRQKLKENYDIYKKIINLDKNAINFFEQKMENFTENDLFLFKNSLLILYSFQDLLKYIKKKKNVFPIILGILIIFWNIL